MLFVSEALGSSRTDPVLDGAVEAYEDWLVCLMAFYNYFDLKSHLGRFTFSNVLLSLSF